MSSKTDLLKNLRVASPCHVGWERMTGDDRVRFCYSCDLNVYNFSEMTPREIELLVLKTEGRVCGRMYKRADGTIITRDCPVGLRALRRRLARRATAVFTALMSLSSVVFSQSSNKQEQSCKEVLSLRVERKKLDPGNHAVFGGVVSDPLGAVVPGAKVTLSYENTNTTSVTDDSGVFRFENLSAGIYQFEVTSVGFKTLQIKTLTINAAEDAKASITLAESITVLTGIMSLPYIEPDIRYEKGRLIIKGDYIRKLPINN